ncbi:MAG: histone H1 [Planctomycetota bacterium]|jgi:rhamnose utilization protein RhaD (predicted bifunctional aldolase and dehydrogenase)|nr:MAG: histone H1 [Planctomycetota bacterium]RLS96648.1 MAG: histone H1 [Planctomycetota bacterium]
MELYDRLVQLVREAEDDMRKAAGGNKAAGTRARKAMQEIREVAQQVRVAILAKRDVADGAA